MPSGMCFCKKHIPCRRGTAVSAACAQAEDAGYAPANGTTHLPPPKKSARLQQATANGGKAGAVADIDPYVGYKVRRNWGTVSPLIHIAAVRLMCFVCLTCSRCFIWSVSARVRDCEGAELLMQAC